MKLARLIQTEMEQLLEDWGNADEVVRFNEAIAQLIANPVSSDHSRKGQNTRLIETMLNASQDPSAIFDPEGKHLFINKAMADLVNASDRDVIGKTPCELGLASAAKLHDAIITTVTTGQNQRLRTGGSDDLLAPVAGSGQGGVSDQHQRISRFPFYPKPCGPMASEAGTPGPGWA